MNPRNHTYAIVLTALLALWGCSSGGSSGNSTSVDVLVKDATIPGVLAVRTTLEQVRLEKVSGDLSRNLLLHPVDVEWLGLDERAMFVSRQALSSNKFVALVVTFRDFEAIDVSGELIPVNVTGSELRVEFASPWKPANNQNHSLLLDFDVAGSWMDSIAGNPAELSPKGSVAINASSLPALTPMLAVVQSAGSVQDIQTRVFTTDDSSAELGQVRLSLQQADMLIGMDGSILDNADDFLDRLTPGQTILEWTGQRQNNGSVQVHRAEILNSNGNVDDLARLQVEGLVLSLVPGVSMDLLWQHACLGDSDLEDLVDDLDDPSKLPVAMTGATRVYQDNELQDPLTALAVGQRILVQVENPKTVPVIAKSIDILHAEPRLNGSIFDVDQLPDWITIHVDAEDPNVVSGVIDSDTTEVMVDLRGSRILLDGDLLDLEADELLVGMDVEVQGSLTGNPMSPTATASKTTVRRGQVLGCVVSINEAVSRFEMAVSVILDEFDEDTDLAQVIEVRLRDETTFTGVAENESDFYDVFENLAPNEALRVDVIGLLTNTPNRIAAGSVESSIVTQTARRELWPPNHRLVILDLHCDFDLNEDLDLTDLKILSVTQDEEVNGKGDGNTAPDAVIVSDTVAMVRAERQGGGNGRVYELVFSYTDDDDILIEDAIEITVPHSQNGDPAEDDGQIHDSTEED